MKHFSYRNGHLFCEGVSVEKVASEVGTPFYLYSHGTLLENYRSFERALGKIRHLVCYAFKANSNSTLCKILVNAGSGAEVASLGELRQALELGVPGRMIVINGNGKTIEEMELAINSDILMINVDSFEELVLLNDVAVRLGKKARIALRINPDVEPYTHPYIATGVKKSKFGFELERAVEGYKLAKRLGNLEAYGIHMHIGSQITRIEPFIRGLKKLITVSDKLKEIGINLEYVNVGGGLGIAYWNERPPTPANYARALIPLIKKISSRGIFEPGRAIVGNAGIMVTKVLYIKEMFSKKFIVVDAGMSDFIRPTLYDAYHEIKPIKLEEVAKGRWKLERPSFWPPGTRKVMVADVVGPICESGDFFAKDRVLPKISAGDLLAIFCAGAYGFTMSSNYNSRCRAAEILVRKENYDIIRQRETYQDLIRGM
ncbi:diaminopimelate decarboxylase [bacterium]|nr:diaminopimelate decarboxylase [bacterium]